MKKKSARVATQFGRAAQDTKQQSKNKNKNKKSHKSALERPWSTLQFEELTKEERDIVLDRIQKEIVDVIATSSSNSTKGADATTIAPARHAFQSFIARGVNEVARLVAKRELRVVVFANNPESLAFAHIPLLCRLHSVPICVLHLSSKTFGKMFGLNSLVVLGIKRLPRAVSSDKTEDVAVDTSTEATEESAESIEMPLAAATTGLSDLERSRLKSITEFLISKASKKSRTL